MVITGAAGSLLHYSWLQVFILVGMLGVGHDGLRVQDESGVEKVYPHKTFIYLRPQVIIVHASIKTSIENNLFWEKRWCVDKVC